MPDSPNKLSQFWQELKRRNVVRVVTVYAGAAFVIIELINNITEPLKLPEWTPTLVIVLLAIGFPIVIIFSWIYDIHPEGGMVKTEPAEKVKAEEIPKSSSGWKIASYISFVVIVGLIVLNVIPRNGKKEILDKSIAVLPFIDDSPDKDSEHIINGIMEDLLINLQSIKELRVPGRTSTETYRNNPKPISEIASEMKVSYIVEGSGQRYGDKIRLRVQLVEGESDKHIWARSYDEVISGPEDIFRIQSQLAESIAKELQAAITPQEKSLIEKIPTTSLNAYDFYQRGTEEQKRGNAERSEELYRTALQYDSEYANAYLGLASVYWEKHYWETIFEEDFLDSVLVLAELALSIDNQLSDAYVIKGKYFSQVGEPEKALEEIEKAILYNPNNGQAYLTGGYLYRESDLLKSVQYLHKALSLIRGDQLPEMFDNMAWSYLPTGIIDKSIYYYKEAFELTQDTQRYYDRLRICEFVREDFPLAIDYLERAYALDSTDDNLLSVFGEYYMMDGNYEQSLKYFKKWLEKTNSLSQNAVFGMHRVGWAYWMNGMKEEGKAYFNKQIVYCNRILELGHVIGTYWRNYYDLAATYAFLGDTEKALENLRSFRKYLTADRWGITYFKNDPLFDSIRDEPEFQQIVRDVEAKYQAEHERVRQWLEENDML